MYWPTLNDPLENSTTKHNPFGFIYSYISFFVVYVEKLFNDSVEKLNIYP